MSIVVLVPLVDILLSFLFFPAHFLSFQIMPLSARIPRPCTIKVSDPEESLKFLQSIMLRKVNTGITKAPFSSLSDLSSEEVKKPPPAAILSHIDGTLENRQRILRFAYDFDPLSSSICAVYAAILPFINDNRKALDAQERAALRSLAYKLDTYLEDYEKKVVTIQASDTWIRRWAYLLTSGVMIVLTVAALIFPLATIFLFEDPETQLILEASSKVCAFIVGVGTIMALTANNATRAGTRTLLTLFSENCFLDVSGLLDFRAFLAPYIHGSGAQNNVDFRRNIKHNCIDNREEIACLLKQTVRMYVPRAKNSQQMLSLPS